MDGHNQLYKELAGIVGSKYVSDDDFILMAYTRDCGLFPPDKPQGYVVRPGSTEDVVELVRLANQTRTPLVPIGGKATVAGVPPGQPGRGIVVDMRRMDKVIEIDEENMAVTAECGINLGELETKCLEKGWDIHTAAMPHYVDTLGGHISGVPGGGMGAYGFGAGYNWQFTLGLKVVLPNATVVETGAGHGSFHSYKGHNFARCLEGPDTTGLFCGDGGIFGIKTEATYRMHRPPKFRIGGARAFDSLEQAWKVYLKLAEIDPILYMQPWGMGAVFDPGTLNFATMGMAEPAWTVVYQVLGNTKEEVDFKYKATDKALAEGGGRPGKQAAMDFLENYMKLTTDMGRAATFGRYPSGIWELLCSTRDLLPCYELSREFLDKGIKRKDIPLDKVLLLEVLAVCQPGYGISSIIPYYDSTDPEVCRKMLELTYEWGDIHMSHGYLANASQHHAARLLAKWWSPELYTYILTMKKALDPNNIMNPGMFFR